MHLDQIVDHKRREWATRPDSPAVSRVSCPGSFRQALRGPRLSVIAEIKPASPSKGALLPRKRAVPMAQEYERLGASAVSVLADERFFHGGPDLVEDVAAAVACPVLYKDFVVDIRQVQLAAASGAAAVLAIARALDDPALAAVLDAARTCGLDVLVETFDEHEIDRALTAGAQIIGVNNRDLQTFEVDLDRARRLRRHIPDDVVTVSESGIASRDDALRVAEHGYDAVLVGEHLLTAADLAHAMAQLMGITTGRVAA